MKNNVLFITINLLKQTIEAEKYIMYKNGKGEEFDKQWYILTKDIPHTPT